MAEVFLVILDEYHCTLLMISPTGPSSLFEPLLTKFLFHHMVLLDHSELNAISQIR